MYHAEARDLLAPLYGRFTEGFSRSSAARIAPGEFGAGHDQDLIEHHQRQDDEAQGVAGKQQIRHRDPGDEALFRAAEYDHDLILSREAETASGKRSDRQH